MGFGALLISACKAFSQWDDRTFYESNIKRIQWQEIDKARRRSERHARRRAKRNEALVAEMQMMRIEKCIRFADDCKMKNKMDWEQWQSTTGNRSKKGDAWGTKLGKGWVNQAEPLFI